jgi:predicted RNA-binding Zn-ribbon protein involved in translation (DUF1610 family)
MAILSPKVMNFAYGFGAAVVIVGALFKLMHWPGASAMLIAGLGTEAFIFGLSAFEAPAKELDWTLVYPELAGGEAKTKKEREKGKGKKENGEKIAVVLKCPKCGQGEIVKGKTAWGCTLYRKSCDFLIPMEIQGKKLTQKQVDTLIQKGQTGKISGFKDPEGNSFNGIVRLDENKNIIVDKI